MVLTNLIGPETENATMHPRCSSPRNVPRSVRPNGIIPTERSALFSAVNVSGATSGVRNKKQPLGLESFIWNDSTARFSLSSDVLD
ncbi:hypothetical protein JD844_015481 [Phrynosoma platyrhinos]|uniref:Uncharacterized protein n=1 Tax=Phrynosoma platyrhinos TaxID=52577 RepID=A0ABQ7SJ69_PHRPL|nr:hypothetical protein JD844_015481 [Phrynosoma platyrhinos]